MRVFGLIFLLLSFSGISFAERNFIVKDPTTHERIFENSNSKENEETLKGIEQFANLIKELRFPYFSDIKFHSMKDQGENGYVSFEIETKVAFPNISDEFKNLEPFPITGDVVGFVDSRQDLESEMELNLQTSLNMERIQTLLFFTAKFLIEKECQDPSSLEENLFCLSVSKITLDELVSKGINVLGEHVDMTFIIDIVTRLASKRYLKGMTEDKETRKTIFKLFDKNFQVIKTDQEVIHLDFNLSTFKEELHSLNPELIKTFDMIPADSFHLTFNKDSVNIQVFAKTLESKDLILKKVSSTGVVSTLFLWPLQILLIGGY